MKLEKALDQCLRDIQEHNTTVEDCLARYPKQAEALEPLLRLAVTVAEVPPVRPAPEFKRATRKRLLALSPPARSRPRRDWARALAFATGALGRRLAMASVVAALIIVVLSGSAAVAAADSPPDSPLYPIKRATEQARLLLTPNDAARAKLHIAYAQRRLDEAVLMAQRGEEGRAKELLDEYRRELQAAIAVVEVLTVQTARLSVEIQGEVAQQTEALESTAQTLPPEVRRLGLAVAKEAVVGLSTLSVSLPVEPPSASPSPTESELVELATPTATELPAVHPTATETLETPLVLESSPTAQVSPTATAGGMAFTATKTPSLARPIRATPTSTEEITPEPTLPTATTVEPARLTPTPTPTPIRLRATPTFTPTATPLPRATPTSTVPSITPTSSPELPAVTPTPTPEGYPGPTDTPVSEATPTPTATPVPPTATPTPEPYPAPTDTSTPESEATPTLTPPSSQASTPSPTATPVPPTATPTPEAYPVPTDTPTPVPPTATPTTVPPSAQGDTPTPEPDPTATPPPPDTPTAEPYPPPPGGQ